MNNGDKWEVELAKNIQVIKQPRACAPLCPLVRRRARLDGHLYTNAHLEQSLHFCRIAPDEWFPDLVMFNFVYITAYHVYNSIRFNATRNCQADFLYR